MEALEPVGIEVAPLSAAVGRVLGRDLCARRALPPFDNSAMDGYGVRAEDTVGASAATPARLRVVGEVSAGATFSAALEPGDAVRIFTGAPTPAGIDAVVIQEKTRTDGDTVLIDAPASAQQNIRRCGEDMSAGEVILRRGTRLRPGDIGAIASQGYSWLHVHRRPTVAILPTGDELVEIDAPLEPGKIVNSNSALLAAQVSAAGGIPVRLPPAPDDPDALRDALRAAARGSDLIMSCGGVSVGAHDHVRDVLQELGHTDFWKVAIKPGKPLAFGHVLDVPLLGLPGNPVSAFVVFELFGQPALARLSGAGDWRHRSVQLPLAESLQPNAKRRELVRARLEQTPEALRVRPHRERGSGQQSSLLAVQALIDIPPSESALPAGTPVRTLLLNG